MNVALDKAKVSIKPGFGKIPDRPSFAKAGSVKAMFGTKDTAATAQTSSLKSTVSSNIATSSRSSVFTSRAQTSRSSSFVPATRFMDASDFVRDRTRTAAWGEIQGDHYIEGQTGVTKRSYRRMVQSQQATAAPEYQTRYANLSSVYSQNMSPMQFISDLGTTITSIIGMFKTSDTGAAGSTGSPVSTVSSAAVQTAQTLAGNVGSIATASTTAELQSAIAEAKTQQAQLQELLNSDDYANVETNLQSAKDAKTEIDAQVTEQQGIVSNQQKTIELLSGTRIPAQETVVGNAEQALEQAKSQATAENPNTAAISAAQKQLDEAKATLNQLKEQLKKAEETKNEAQQKLDGGEGLLAKQKEAANDISTLTSLQNDKQAKTTQLNTLEQNIKSGEQRQEKMLQQEEKKMDGMLKDLQKLDAKIAGEKDESKKTELRQEYAQLAETLNSLASNSTSTKYANANVNTETTMTEMQQATRQANLDKMKEFADTEAKKREEETRAMFTMGQ